MSVPLIEQQGSAVSSNGNAQVSTATASTASGPSVTVAFSGSTYTITEEHLRFYLLLLQTFLMLYVAYLEVSSR